MWPGQVSDHWTGTEREGSENESFSKEQTPAVVLLLLLLYQLAHFLGQPLEIFLAFINNFIRTTPIHHHHRDYDICP